MKTPEANLIKKSHELTAILEVSKVLTSSFDLEGNLSQAMSILGTSLQLQRGCVFLLDPGSQELRIVAAHGLTSEEIRRGTYRIGEGIVGRVIESGQPMFVPDIGEEPKFLNRTGARPKKSGISFLSMPIQFKSRTVGVISVDRIYSEDEGDVDDDLRVLKIVSSLIAQFVMLWEHYKEADLERESLRSQLKDRFNLSNIVGESERIQAVLKTLLKVAGTDATVLLTGESGTGKELFARALHFESKRAKGPFIAVNCAALPENLLEAELFGCEKGAFTGAVTRRIGRFELAAGGTIFLDEIGEFSVVLQAKLLRVIQEKTFERVGSSKPIQTDVRLIAATNRNLLDDVKKGKFRDDLYWRLNVIPIVLPPLRSREGDIPLLINHYVRKFNLSYGRRVGVSVEAMNIFSSYQWPGNVRELANTVERLVIMAEKEVIGPDDIPYNVRQNLGQEECRVCEEAGIMPSLKSEVLSLERERIERALSENGFVQHRAAKALGITPRQLNYRVKKYNIPLVAQPD